MPKIDFYILQDAAPDARLRFACRLAEKAVEQGLKVFMSTPEEEMARLDDLLWTYSDRSFLPHEIASTASPSHERISVLIGNGSPPSTHAGLLINLSNVVPTAFETTERLAEVVGNDNELKSQARERFKFYRDKGLTIDSHNV
jgi:DNA polymerase-3 subunit chi